jgi:oxygen-dependent protoporphyrinogen oxidase
VEQLVRSTVARLPATTVRLGVGARRITAEGDGFRIGCDDGATFPAEHVILATPAYVSAVLVEGLNSSLSIELSRIPFVSSATVTLAYADSPAFPGSGYVCPRAEGGPAVAVTWASNKFPGRAPSGAALVRVFLGRAGDEAWAEEADDVLITEARREIERVSRVEQEPVLARVFRWPRGLPQYVIGHLDRMERIAALVRGIPGLHLAGASYRGVGIPDCITSGWAAADAVLRSLRVAA